MKKMMFLAMMMTIAVSANAMTYSEARNKALFLSDKMAYELALTDAQYNAVYEINLDYLLSVNSRYDVYGTWWDRRNADLRYVLAPWQYNKYVSLSDFYRPLSWNRGAWVFHIHNRYGGHVMLLGHRPSGYLTYHGGYNHRPANFYAGRFNHHHDNGPRPGIANGPHAGHNGHGDRHQNGGHGHAPHNNHHPHRR